ncbi:HAD-IIIC family phosphatase [Micromonospora sp. NPDC048871]|uniref:HAD-IIIC family phosphatase n=1 Tax=unclassified Micromonospora TaxID=2617518 RepID=UPI002E12C5B9|nr:HAD-IIIC family phosphatase [Micromonospora sp. NBC_01739]
MTLDNGPATIKCLVWDLDNTLWKGTLLEDGEVHLSDEIRQIVIDLDARGILQSVASRNDHDEAWAQLEKLGLAEYFVVPQISWGRKSDAVRHIADTLKFAQHTIAFIDDHPAERAEVAFHLPEVRCYPAEEALRLAELPEFNPPVITADSRRRREMYQASNRRDTERASFDGPEEEFLRSLDLRMGIDRATDADIARLEELTLRTSQMNATGVHYSEETLRGMVATGGHDVLVVSMTDRFGPHGAVGVILLERYPGVYHLKLLATSCRVVAFGAGAVILRWLTDQAARADAHLVADFRRSDRNRMMEVAYRFAGFDEQPCDCLAALPAADDLQRLHLSPQPQLAPTTITVVAVDLRGGDEVAADWTCALT